jgi:hypothetical protein
MLPGRNEVLGNKCETVEYASFTVCIKEGAVHCCKPVGCRTFCDVFLLYFLFWFWGCLDILKYVTWYECIERVSLVS